MYPWYILIVFQQLNLFRIRPVQYQCNFASIFALRREYFSLVNCTYGLTFVSQNLLDPISARCLKMSDFQIFFASCSQLIKIQPLPALQSLIIFTCCYLSVKRCSKQATFSLVLSTGGAVVFSAQLCSNSCNYEWVCMN